MEKYRVLIRKSAADELGRITKTNLRRIVYSIDDSVQTVEVVKIVHRSTICRDWEIGELLWGHYWDTILNWSD